MSTCGTTLTKDQILEDLRQIFADDFEVDPALVSLDARLYEDLDIDSIDAVDLMVTLKNRTGQKLDPEAFKQVRTIGDVVDAVHALLNK